MNKWFEETFLPSLFERVGTSDKGRWLSQKQTAVCCRNMELHSCAVQCDPLECYRHDDYYCKWRGREVWLFYSRKNFCGCIRFGLTEEENAALRAERESEEKAEEMARRARYLDDLRHGRVRARRKIDFDELLKRKQDDLDEMKSYTDLTDDEIIAIEELEEEIAAMMEFKAKC